MTPEPPHSRPHCRELCTSWMPPWNPQKRKDVALSSFMIWLNLPIKTLITSCHKRFSLCWRYVIFQLQFCVSVIKLGQRTWQHTNQMHQKIFYFYFPREGTLHASRRYLLWQRHSGSALLSRCCGCLWERSCGTECTRFPCPRYDTVDCLSLETGYHFLESENQVVLASCAEKTSESESFNVIKCCKIICILPIDPTWSHRLICDLLLKTPHAAVILLVLFYSLKFFKLSGYLKSSHVCLSPFLLQVPLHMALSAFITDIFHIFPCL